MFGIHREAVDRALSGRTTQRPDTFLIILNAMGINLDYQELGDFEVTESNSLYTLLKDRETGQILCICYGQVSIK